MLGCEIWDYIEIKQRDHKVKQNTRPSPGLAPQEILGRCEFPFLQLITETRR